MVDNNIVYTYMYYENIYGYKVIYVELNRIINKLERGVYKYMKSGKFVHVLKSKKLSVVVMSTALVMFFSFNKVHAYAVTDRFSGVNRYETAAKVCEDGWRENTDYAVIVNGENFPDALSAAPLAKKYNAPILLTGENMLNPYTSVQLNRLNVKNVFLIGGKAVISQSTEDALKARGIKVTRIGGVDRYDTSIKVAQKIGKSNQIALVNGNQFHDGMSISSIAGLKGMPIVLTDRDYMPAVVKKYIQSNKSADQIYVVGGSDQISDEIVKLIPNGKRIGDGDVFSRNIGVIKAFQNELSTGTIYLASTKDFPDSLVASAIAPKTSSPIIFVDNPMSSYTYDFLRSKIVNNIKVLGGPGVIDYSTQQSVETIPLDIANVDNFTDIIWQNEKYNPRPTIVVTATDGTIKEVPVTWNLTKINTSKPGVYTLYGKIDGTYRTIVTTLIVKPLPVKVEDVNAETKTESEYSLPETVSAQMSDGTVVKVPVTWDYGNQQINTLGMYTFYGTVEKYNKKVKLTLVVRNEGGGSTTPDSQFDDTTIEIVQGEPYTLPKTVLDKITNKNLPVTWNTKSIDTSRTGTVRLEGVVKDSAYKAYLTLIVVPKIADVPEIRETVVQGSYYSMPTKVAAKTSDGKTIYVDVTWDKPFIDLGTPQTYYIKGTVKHYKNPVVLVLKVVSN